MVSGKYICVKSLDNFCEGEVYFIHDIIFMDAVGGNVYRIWNKFMDYGVLIGDIQVNQLETYFISERSYKIRELNKKLIEYDRR